MDARTALSALVCDKYVPNFLCALSIFSCALENQGEIHEGVRYGMVWEECHGVCKRCGETLWAARLGFCVGE